FRAGWRRHADDHAHDAARQRDARGDACHRHGPGHGGKLRADGRAHRGGQARSLRLRLASRRRVDHPPRSIRGGHMTRRDFDPETVTPDGRPPAKARLFDATVDGPYRGSINGETLATQITVLTYGNDEPGVGPVLHVHP